LRRLIYRYRRVKKIVRRSTDQKQIGERFVICDPGGATVVSRKLSSKRCITRTLQDLISYKVVGLRPFSVKEAAIGDGETPDASATQITDGLGEIYGSIYLDIAFEDFVVLLTGEEQYEKLTPSAKRKMIQIDFDRVKRRFGSDEDGDDKYSVELRGVKHDAANGIVDETITIER
jgi:hypothetical protein